MADNTSEKQPETQDWKKEYARHLAIKMKKPIDSSEVKKELQRRFGWNK